MDEKLLNLYNIFYQGQFEKAIEYDTNELTEDSKLVARVLQLRAQIALGNLDEVIDEVHQKIEPEFIALRALAKILKRNEAEALSTVESLGAVKGIALILVATTLQIAGKSEEALSMLADHQGDLEAVALRVQIYLSKNRTDLALKEVSAARSWAQDNLLVNLAESWVGLRIGGEKYQQAFYVFEELAQAASTSSSQNLISQAISEIHLGRLEEAEAALQQVLTNDKHNPEAIVNSIVLNSISGCDVSQLLLDLEKITPDHTFLRDIQEKKVLFDKAGQKYSSRIAAS